MSDQGEFDNSEDDFFDSDDNDEPDDSMTLDQFEEGIQKEALVR